MRLLLVIGLVLELAATRQVARLTAPPDIDAPVARASSYDASSLSSCLVVPVLGHGTT